MIATALRENEGLSFFVNVLCVGVVLVGFGCKFACLALSMVRGYTVVNCPYVSDST